MQAERMITFTCLCRSRKILRSPVLLKEVKGDSSSWIKSQGRQFRNFHWQDGYGAFSFAYRDLSALKQYVSSQKEHHRKWTFKNELIFMLEESGLEYDERYLWD